MNNISFRCFHCSISKEISTYLDKYQDRETILLSVNWIADKDFKQAFCCLTCQIKAKRRLKKHLQLVQNES